MQVCKYSILCLVYIKNSLKGIKQESGRGTGTRKITGKGKRAWDGSKKLNITNCDLFSSAYINKALARRGEEEKKQSKKINCRKTGPLA